MNRPSRRRVALGAVALAAGIALAGCSDDNPSVEQTAGTSTSSTSSTSTSTSTTLAPTATTATQRAGGSGGTSKPAATQPAGPAPVITSFETPENIDCHNGNSQTFTATWTTTNAVKVTISIDGPGVYKTYGPNGEASLPFNCSKAHTFLLTAYNQGGQKATKSVTLQPRNVQTPSNDNEEE